MNDTEKGSEKYSGLFFYALYPIILTNDLKNDTIF